MKHLFKNMKTRQLKYKRLINEFFYAFIFFPSFGFVWILFQYVGCSIYFQHLYESVRFEVPTTLRHSFGIAQ